ncbi:ABC transporter substrate-binding protein [Amphritea sp. 1_MG-2023]|uniref:ABC transporter substrate-binding protein n=1 Tax=Amphritea sp. 1_MG-2023 TaxID=3062670 RepID=UPI0026E19B19|nr:ABC transporter substrate-binding protein [Amphritea sp. 1_MG-2023]MDO6564571.1 ABC transporter substrate-binding protein [Amphritea sp. 1_MG-2023]
MKIIRKTALILAILLPALAQASETLTIRIGFIAYHPDQGPVLSNLIPEPKDRGFKGAELGIKDNNTTGRFLKQKFNLASELAESPEQVSSIAQGWLDQGIKLLVADLPATQLTQLVDLATKHGAAVFNAGSYANELRSKQCLKNTLHTLPSRAMLTDALAQWANAKRLSDWLIIRGDTPEDIAYADSLKRSSKRFGINVIEEKTWDFDTDLRRTAQKELPLFTQTAEYDLVVVADERGDFGEYVQYNTWYPRPVAGTQGLTPVAWHRVVEQWGAAQLQSRFEKLSSRWMNDKDYAAWAAVRSIGEAVTQTRSDSPEELFSFITSDKFQLAGFKGRKLNYRLWSGQLRQPIPMVHPKSLVSQPPLEGFLHPVTELDTLGFDKPESQCQVSFSN